MVVSSEVLRGPSGGIRTGTRYHVNLGSKTVCVDVSTAVSRATADTGGDPKRVVELFAGKQEWNESEEEIKKLPMHDALRIAKSLRASQSPPLSV
jgi:hypothetical protein